MTNNGTFSPADPAFRNAALAGRPEGGAAVGGQGFAYPDDFAVWARLQADRPWPPPLVKNHAILMANEELRAQDMDTFLRSRLAMAPDQAAWNRRLSEFASRYGVGLPRQLGTYSPELARHLLAGGLPYVLRLVVLNHRDGQGQAGQRRGMARE
jgi:hypothetical protein